MVNDIDELFGISKIITPTIKTASIVNLDKTSFFNSTVKVSDGANESESILNNALNCDNIYAKNGIFVGVFLLDSDFLLPLKKKAVKCKFAGMDFDSEIIKIFCIDYRVSDIKLYDGCCEFTGHRICHIDYEFKIVEMHGNFYVIIYSGSLLSFGRVSSSEILFKPLGENMQEITKDGIIRECSRNNKVDYNELVNSIGMW